MRHNNYGKISVSMTLAIAFLWTSLSMAQWEITNYPEEFKINTIARIDGFILVGTDSLILRSSDDGETWEFVSNGLNGTRVNDLIYDETANETVVYAATDSGVFATTNYGNDWYALNNGIDSINIRSLYKTENYMFAGVTSGESYYSKDDGTIWKPMMIDASSHVVNAFIRHGDVMLAGLSDFYNPEIPIYISYDFGLNWEKSDSVISIGVSAFAKLGDRIFASNTSLIEGSNDAKLWLDKNQSIPSGYPIPELKTFGDYLFILSGNGLFQLHRDSITTINITDNIAFPIFLSIDIDNELIVLGSLYSEGYSIWTKRIATTSIAHDNNIEIPQKVTLNSNYPNPFNPSTIIGYSLPQSGFVQLKVYDVLGREVAVLVNEQQKPGNHEVQFDASGLSSGIYFYKLRSEGFIQTKKMLLLR